MPVIDSGSIHVFSFKEGLLSRVAHDLRFSLTRFRIELDGERVTANFEPNSLKVDGVMKKGQLNTSTLSAKDIREVIENTEKSVLRTNKFLEIRFEGKAERGSTGGYRVGGRLHLTGRTAAVSFALEEQGGRLKGRAVLMPTQWGIKPFKALLGAIKIQDRVIVEFDLPAV